MTLFTDETLHIAHNDLTDKSGFSLSAIMANEIYFIEDFLNHYRPLGVERFFLLDDRSTDGSLEFAKEQPDVMILKSDHSYGDTLIAPNRKHERAMLAWRNTILQNYAFDEWHAHLDLDEFISLPQGMTLPQLVEHAGSANMIWASMIDLYPKNWQDILDDPSQKIGNLSWYFDGRPHYKFVKPSARPTLHYSGARARLRHDFGSYDPGKEKLRRRIIRKIRRNPYPQMGDQRKPALMKWQNNMAFRSSHYIKNPNGAPIILPLMHYKFAPNFVRKIQFAQDRKSHNAQGKGYMELAEVKSSMEKQGANFLAPCSKLLRGFQDFEDAGIAVNVPRPKI